jgi:AraC family transcriptional regulator
VVGLVQAIEEGAPVLGGCARLRHLHSSPLLAVDLWRCVEDGEGLRSERFYPVPVFAVLLSGASVLQEGGRALIVEAGTTLLAHAGAVYQSSHPFGCGDIGCHIRPSPAVLEHLRIPTGHFTVVPTAPRTHLRFRLAVERMAIIGGDGLELEEAALALLAAATDRTQVDREPRLSRRQIELVEATKALLLERFCDSLRLDEVARQVGASPFHLARLFRRATGLSLHGYRTRLRLLHALERLEEARGALTDLALELGFSSQSHFTDAFRGAFGLPPGAVSRAASRGLAMSARHRD